MNEPVIKASGVTKIYNIRERGYRSFKNSFSRSVNRVMQKLGRKNQDNVLSDTDNNVIHALDNVSFKVERGEALGIIGANGSGKTTVLRLLANVTKPSSGEISVRGKVAPLIQVGAGFHPELTGRENVYLNATIMGLSKEEIDEKYEDIVSFAEMEKFMDTPVKRYSSGMYVRLGFAVVANIEPDIFLIDEVLAVGDISFQRKCLNFIAKARKSLKTIVFISHNMFAIESITDRVLVLNKGEISYMGKPAEAIKLYMHSMLETKSDLAPDGSFNLKKTEWFNIKNVSLLDRYDKPVEKIKINDPLKIKIDWETSQRVEKPAVDFHLFKDDNIRVLVERSNYHGHFFKPFKGSGTVIIQIKSLPLKRGKYTVLVAISELSVHAAFPVAYHKERSFFIEDNVSTISEGIVSIDAEWVELGSG